MVTDRNVVDRRTVLKGLAASGVMVPLAGCGTWIETDQYDDTLYLERDTTTVGIAGSEPVPEYTAAVAEVNDAYYALGIEEITEDTALLWYEDEAEPVDVMASRSQDETIRKRDRDFLSVDDGEEYALGDLPAPLDTFTVDIQYLGAENDIDTGRVALRFEEDVAHDYHTLI